MNYLQPTKFINFNEYDYVISIGNKCPTTMILRNLNLYKESFPFDYIPTTPELILKYLKNQDDFYPKKNNVRTKDDVWFGHFDINDNYIKTIETFKRRFERLFNVLKNKKKILFVYTTEADIYNEMNNRYNDNFNQLSKIVEYIIETYNYNDFKILCVHTNKTFADTNNIINFTINVHNNYLSDDMKTHTLDTCLLYRQTLENLLKEIFKL
jgi:Putative papain-like cysteine peptidase (DUF1796)